MVEPLGSSSFNRLLLLLTAARARSFRYLEVGGRLYRAYS